MDIICKKLANEMFYAYHKGRFWRWDDARGIWKESHLMAQKFERAKSAIATLTPEDFLGNSAEFEQPDEYELDLTMVEALKDAKPCKNAPIEPVEELHSPSAQCLDAATAAESQTAASPAAPEGSSPTTETANAAKSSDSQGNAVGENAALSAISGSSSDKPLTTIPDDLRPTFDYSGLSDQTVADLHLAENEYMQGRKMAERGLVHMGNAIATAHDALCGTVVAQCDNREDGACRTMRKARNNQYSEDSFRAWCCSVGVTKDTAYRLLQVSALLENSSPRQKEILETLPPTLLYAAAKPSAPQELVERVQTGDITTNKQYQEALKQLKEKDAQLKLSNKRIDELQAHSAKLTCDYNDEFVKRRHAESKLDETRARLKSACVQEQESREAMQAAESARDAALADVQGLSEQNDQLRQSYNEANDARIAARLQCQKAEAERDKAETRAKNAEEALKKQPITAVVDEEEVDRRAHQQAYGIAADMTAELKASRDKLQEDNAALQQQLDEAHSVDPQEDLENVIACRVNLESAWSMARSCSNRLVGTGESLNNALHAIISLCDSIHKEAVSIIIKNDKETQYE